MPNKEQILENADQIKARIEKKLKALQMLPSDEVLSALGQFNSSQRLLERKLGRSYQPLTKEEKAAKCKWCGHLERYHTGLKGPNGRKLCKYGCRYCRGFELKTAA